MYPPHFRFKRLLWTLPAASTPSYHDAAPVRYKREKLLFDKLNIIQSLLKSRDAGEPQFQAQADGNAANLLDHVLHEVYELNAEKSLKSSKNSSDCKIQGQWVSESAGGLFTFPEIDFSNTQDIPINRKYPHDRVHNGFMNYKDWNTSLTFPYGSNLQYIMINGWNERDKIVATFLGECRLCRKKELLQGNWLIVSHSRDCESLGTTAKLISDVFRRDTIEKLKKKHLHELHIKRNRKERVKPEEEVASEKGESIGTEKAGTSETLATEKYKSDKSTPLHIKLH